jgi:hypothetical protein
MIEVPVVFDTESDPDNPFPIGVYVTTEESVVSYERRDGEICHAPADCVTIRRVVI